MNVQSIQRRVLMKAIYIFTVIFLFSSCATSPDLIFKPSKGSFYIPLITLGEQVENIGYKVPVTSIKLTKNKNAGTVVKTKNTEGLETYKAIIVEVCCIKKGYAFIKQDKIYDSIIMQSGDQILDHVTKTLLKLIETNHKTTIEGFQSYKKE
jgi:hypothetical protein